MQVPKTHLEGFEPDFFLYTLHFQVQFHMHSLQSFVDRDSWGYCMVCETLHYKNQLKSRSLLDLPPAFAGLKKK